MIDIKKIIKEYEANENIFTEDNVEIYYIKKSLMQQPDADKIIFILYSEFGSLRKVAKELKVSHTIIYREIKRIKNNILELAKKLKENDSNKSIIY